MATAREIEEAIAILIGGRVGSAAVGAAQRARAETKAFKALSRTAQIRAAGATAARGGKFVGRQAITKNPYGLAALLAYEGYIHRDEIADVAEKVFGVMGEAVEFYESETGQLPTMGSRRKVSKANKAVKHAMGLLKAGPKRSTGADKGKLPKGAFKMATKAAGLANPKTKSKIGKGKGKLKALARKIRSWWK